MTTAYRLHTEKGLHHGGNKLMHMARKWLGPSGHATLFGLVFGAFATILPTAQAADVKVEATVDRNQISSEDTLTLDVRITSDGSWQVDDPQLPDLSSFEILNQWSSRESRSMFTNGQFTVEQSQVYHYQLAPRPGVTGTVQIDRVAVVVDGRSIYTQPIRIEITKGAGGGGNLPPPGGGNTIPSPGGGADPFGDMDDLFSQLLDRRLRPGFRSQPVNPKDAFFIQVETDKTEAYVGEPIVASWYLYTRGHVQDIDTLKYPTLKGFWKEDIEIATRLNFQNEVVNGVVYQKALLASYALFPIREGKTRIDAYKAKCTVLVPAQFGLARPYAFTKTSQEIDIKVKAIPSLNRPAHFNGAVGRFQLKTELDKKEVNANEPLTLKLDFTGRGNAKLINLPKLDVPKSFESFDEKSEAQFAKDGSSVKKFEILLLPREPGEFVIPSMKFSSFDPQTEKFYDMTSPEFKVKVLPSKDGGQIASSPLAASASGDEAQESKPAEPPRLKHEWLVYAWWPKLEPHHELIGVLIMLLLSGGIAFYLDRRERHVLLGAQVEARWLKVESSFAEAAYADSAREMVNLIYFLLGQLSRNQQEPQFEALIKLMPPSLRIRHEESLRKAMQQLNELAFAPEQIWRSNQSHEDLLRLKAQVATLVRALKVDLARVRPAA